MITNVCLWVSIPFPITDVFNTDALIPSLTVSLLTFSILMFITGLLLGTLLLKTPNKNDEVPAPAPGTAVPLYEEIQPPLAVRTSEEFVNTIANEAYGYM